MRVNDDHDRMAFWRLWEHTSRTVDGDGCNGVDGRDEVESCRCLGDFPSDTVETLSRIE